MKFMFNPTLNSNIHKPFVLLHGKQSLFSTNNKQALLEQIVKEKTSCIHTLFCVNESLEFYSELDLHNKIPLIVNSKKEHNLPD